MFKPKQKSDYGCEERIQELNGRVAALESALEICLISFATITAKACSSETKTSDDRLRQMYFQKSSKLVSILEPDTDEDQQFQKSFRKTVSRLQSNLEVQILDDE